MTEYTTSPQAIEVFRSSKERTAYWVRSHSPYYGQFHSPDSPPSVVGELEDRESDDDSTHSLPPKMVLKYGDGRGNIPISHWHYENGPDPHLAPRHARPRPHTTFHTHDRARSAADVYPPSHLRYPVHHHHPTRHGLPRASEDDFSTPPEEIHILPSDPNVQPHRPTGTYRPRRSSEPQRRPLPQSAAPLEDEPEVIEPLPPRYPPNHVVDGPPPVMYSHSQHIHDPYDHQHPSHSHSRGNRPPPSIVYAPGHHHANDHYAPPTIVYAPHTAPGMSYTVSAPTGSGFPQYPRITATPYNPVRSNLSSVHEEPRYGIRGPMHRENSMPRAPSPISDAASGDSGGTYYIIPTPGQKVKVLVGPEPSLYTASSTTKSASSPHSRFSGASSGGGGMKKPLFTRLMGFASDLRAPRNFLQRRHSLTSVRARSRER